MNKGRSLVNRAALLRTLLVAFAVCGTTTEARPAGTDPLPIPAGSYRPVYTPVPRPGSEESKLPPRQRVPVAAFALDRRPVTNAEFLAFVTAHPEWRRSRVKRIHADRGYLSHWQGDLELGPRAPAAAPVVHVSWFAARAFLAAQGKRLPTTAEWEYVAAADETRRDATDDPAYKERLRAWYGRPTPSVLPEVGQGRPNLYGIEDLHGLVWEWTLDFNSALVTGESRGDAAVERSLYCGGGASGASDFRDYAAFMRYGFRSSLAAAYTTANLGFRGARSAEPGPAPATAAAPRAHADTRNAAVAPAATPRNR